MFIFKGVKAIMSRTISHIQSLVKGNIYRKHNLPNSLLTIQKTLQNHNITLSKTSADGRINSCLDEDEIVKILLKEFPDRIHKPKSRMWYDILIHDYKYGWLPVNIKTTTTLTSDNTGNLAMCVYAYTDQQLDLHKTYQNGIMSIVLLNKLAKKEYNYDSKKDYYFVVVNKENKNDIIINSVKGLTELTPNINNLPFQVCWNKNRIYNYKPISKNIKMLLNAIQKPKPSWKETFLANIREITL